MFGKITKQQVAHHFNKAKIFLGNAYNHTKNFLGDVDSGVKNLKTIYSVVSPILESYGVSMPHKNVMKALTSYDTIKSNVMQNHDKIVNDINNVRDTLAKKQVRFDIA
jgi:hypothetical protein